MAMDYKKADDYIAQADEIEKTLLSNKELFDGEKLYEFQQTTKALKRDIQTAQKQSRKLSIGIIGAMKAGKSSFLKPASLMASPFHQKAATPIDSSAD